MTTGDVLVKVPCGQCPCCRAVQSGQCPCCRAVQNYRQNIDLSRDIYGFIPITGWICRKCGRSNSPSMAQCLMCPGGLNTKTTGDTSE